MPSIRQFDVEIIDNRCIAESVFEIRLAPHNAMLSALPGQFVELAVDNSLEPMLRRPFSICSVDKAGSWSIIYRVHGRGTQRLSQQKAGTVLNVLGPLGRGFQLPTSCTKQPVVLVGGGVGAPPMVFLAQRLLTINILPIVLLGFASANAVICTDHFQALNLPTQVATNDGSFGNRGFVTSLLQQVEQPGVVYACGPFGMLAAVANHCVSQHIPCQVSLEEKMGCGVGACLSCVCRTHTQTETSWRWQRVCKEGPVFDAAEVAFDVGS